MSEINKIKSFKSFSDLVAQEKSAKIAEENVAKRSELASKISTLLDEMNITSFEDLDEEVKKEFITKAFGQISEDEAGLPAEELEDETKDVTEPVVDADGSEVKGDVENVEKDLELEGPGDAKSEKIAEGNAFLGARAKAIEEDRDEFEFNGKSYKVTTKSNVSEGNAFGDAVRKAKEAGDKEFEFEGETYKVEEAYKINEEIFDSEMTADYNSVLTTAKKYGIPIAVAMATVASMGVAASIVLIKKGAKAVKSWLEQSENESVVTEGKDDYVARYADTNINLKKGYKHLNDEELKQIYLEIGELIADNKLKVKDATLTFESTVTEGNQPHKEIEKAIKGMKGVSMDIKGDTIIVSNKAGDEFIYSMNDADDVADFITTIEESAVTESVPKCTNKKGHLWKEIDKDGTVECQYCGLRNSLSESTVTEAKFDKKKLMKAVTGDDGIISTGDGKEYIIYKYGNGNDDNDAMWNDKSIIALDQDGEEYEIEYSDIVRYDESLVNEAEIKSDDEFKEYAFTVLKKAFGNDFDEAKAGEVVDGILSKSDGDYGAAVGMLTSSLG